MCHKIGKKRFKPFYRVMSVFRPSSKKLPKISLNTTGLMFRRVTANEAVLFAARRLQAFTRIFS